MDIWFLLSQYPVKMFYLGNGFNESNAVHLELDMKELRSQLQDEKRYSMELKKELDRLLGLIANQTEISKVSMNIVLFV